MHSLKLCLRDAPPVEHSTTVCSAHTVSMCFAFISKQTATFALYNANWLVFYNFFYNPKAIVRLEGLCQWNNPITPSGIEPANFWLVNQLCHRVPHVYLYTKWKRGCKHTYLNLWCVRGIVLQCLIHFGVTIAVRRFKQRCKLFVVLCQLMTQYVDVVSHLAKRKTGTASCYVPIGI
jgi:hypothetical protein